MNTQKLNFTLKVIAAFLLLTLLSFASFGQNVGTQTGEFIPKSTTGTVRYKSINSNNNGKAGFIGKVVNDSVMLLTTKDTAYLKANSPFIINAPLVKISGAIAPAQTSRTLRIDTNNIVYADSNCCGSGTPTGYPNKLAYFDSVGNLNSSGIINSLISPNVEAIADSDGNFIIFAENALILGRGDNNDNDSVTNIGVGLGAISFEIDNASGGIAIYQFPTDTPSIGETLIATYNDGNGQAALQWGDADTNRYLPLAGGTMDLGSSIFFGSGGQNISQGSFDNGTSGNQGVSLNCAVGYELNWQGGRLSNRQGGTYVDLNIDSSTLVLNNGIASYNGNWFLSDGGAAKIAGSGNSLLIGEGGNGHLSLTYDTLGERLFTKSTNDLKGFELNFTASRYKFGNYGEGAGDDAYFKSSHDGGGAQYLSYHLSGIEVGRIIYDSGTSLPRFGINTTTPAATLDITGTLRLTDGTQGNGYILTSDANGDASWQPKPYKEYFGYFQENGVLNDTIVVAGVLYNELGTITPIVDALGRYKFYGDFPINKTLVLCNASNSSGGAVRDVVITFDEVDEDFIQLDMRSKDTGLLQGDNLFHLQIKVLP
jgi:hypothetical protein